MIIGPQNLFYHKIYFKLKKLKLSEDSLLDGIHVLSGHPVYPVSEIIKVQNSVSDPIRGSASGITDPVLDPDPP